MLTSLWWIPGAATRGRRAGHSTGSRREKRGGNCSLPLMTSGNNISEVRRDSYLPLPRRSTWKSRPNSGMLSVRCGLRPRNLYCLIARAACVYISAGWNTARVLLFTFTFRFPPLLYSSLFFLPVTSSHPPTRINRGTVSADSKARSRRIPSLDRCVHLKLIVGSARLDLYKAYQIFHMLSRSYRFFGGTKIDNISYFAKILNELFHITVKSKEFSQMSWIYYALNFVNGDVNLILHI